MRQETRDRLAEMGVTPEKLQHVHDAPSQEEGEKRLAELKEVCKRGFRVLARELHPDVTNNDPEKTARFKRLKSVYESFLKASYKGWRKERARGEFDGVADLFGVSVMDEILYAKDPMMRNFLRLKRQQERQQRDAFARAMIDEMVKRHNKAQQASYRGWQQERVVLAGQRGIWFPQLGKWVVRQKRRHEVSS